MRGNHYHDSKVEKFCVIQGTALIKLRNLLTDKTVEYKVTGGEIEIIDIPAGYSHSIENLGDDELIVLFWANEIFDPSKPDTYASKVAK